MKKIFLKIGVAISCILVLVFLFVACDKPRMRAYYSEKESYITVTGTLVHISNTEEALYLGFSDISEGFSYTETFKIVGENLTVVKQNGIDEKLEIGKTMEFVTAPGCWGDGYVYPMVEISVDGETLLDFEEGFENFLEYLKKNKSSFLD